MTEPRLCYATDTCPQHKPVPLEQLQCIAEQAPGGHIEPIRAIPMSQAEYDRLVHSQRFGWILD